MYTNGKCLAITETQFDSRPRRPYLEMPCLIDLLETSLKDCADCREKVSAL